MSPVYAFFDADGTLLCLRSMFSFERFRLTKRAGLLRRAWHMLLFRTLYRWCPRTLANRLFYRRFAGEHPAVVRADVATWYESLQRPVFRERVVEELGRLRAEGVEPVLVSGSSVDILRPFAAELGIEHVLATRLEVADDRYTGRIVPPQTIGDGKRRAILDFLARSGAGPASCHAFGDHVSDIPMLETVGHPAVVPGDTDLCDHARARAWPILTESKRKD